MSAALKHTHLTIVITCSYKVPQQFLDVHLQRLFRQNAPGHSSAFVELMDPECHAGMLVAPSVIQKMTYHLVMTNIAMENPNHKWRF